MNPQTWVASGHLGGFSDPLMDCKECHERFRADKLIEDFCAEHDIAIEGSVDAWSQETDDGLHQRTRGTDVRAVVNTTSQISVSST